MYIKLLISVICLTHAGLLGAKAVNVFSNQSDSIKYIHTTLVADSLYYKGKLAESALKYREARLIEENSPEPNLRKISESFGNEGYCYYKIGRYNKALEYINNGLKAALAIKDSTEIATHYHNIGVIYFNMANYQKSIENYNKALAIDEKLKSAENIAYDYSVIANVFAAWEKHNQALIFRKKSLAVALNLNDSVAIALRTRSIGSSFLALQMFDSALIYFKESLSIERSLENTNNIVICLDQLGNLYDEKDQTTLAHTYYLEAIKKAEFIEELKTKAILYSNYGKNCLDLKKYDLGFEYLTKSNSIATSIKLHNTIVTNYRLIADYYIAANDYKNAYSNYYKHSVLKDSVFTQTSQQELSKYQARFQTQEKEALIKDLVQQQQLKDLQLLNEKNKRNLAFIIAIFAFAALLATIIIGQKLRSQNNELSRLNSTLKRMFSIISHDLRGAIASYQATGRILKHHISKNQVEMLPQLANEVSKNSQQLSIMLDNLLNWSLSQINKRSFHPQKTSLQKITNFEIDIYQTIADKKNIKISSTITKNTFAYADNEQLQLIIRNLISNAIKFTENGCIDIEAKTNKNFIELSISDTGIGIDEEAAKHIFEITDKKIKYGTQNEKGTGLGLNLVKEYVELNNGSITFDSKPGKGCKFIIKLPANNDV